MTPAQRHALALAAVAPIRYYKGGYYSIPAHAGEDQRAHTATLAGSTPPATLNALVARGYLAVDRHPDIYQTRWHITERGKEALKESHA